MATVLAEGATPLMRIIFIFGLPTALDSVVAPSPLGSSAMPSCSLVVLTYSRGAATGWVPRPNSSLRRLNSTPSAGLATAYRSIGSFLPPTWLQLVILP